MLYQNHIKKRLDNQKLSLYNFVITQGESMSKQNVNNLKDKTSGVRLTQKQVDDLELLAKKHNSSISEQIRKAVEGYILNQRVRNSLSCFRQELSKKSIFEKYKLGIFTIIVLYFISNFDPTLKLPQRFGLILGILGGGLIFAYHPILIKYWKETLTRFLVVFILASSGVFVFSCWQSQIKTFYSWLGTLIPITILILLIVFKIMRVKID